MSEQVLSLHYLCLYIFVNSRVNNDTVIKIVGIIVEV